MQQKTEIINSSRKNRANKHNNSATLQPGYWWLRQHNILTHAICPKIELFSQVVQTVNKYLRETFFEGHTIKFPHGMGSIELAQLELKPDASRGYLGNNLPVDWGATKKLWAENDEAREKKLIVRCTNRVLYRIFYNKNKAHYINRTFFNFAPYRIFQRELAQKAKNNEIKNSIFHI